ncbi:hypothetical protein F5I97DRAFT_1022256 [Phlebopus sp. FC_14]|nr:hypothetical protein F5I97DRAFT_1022256 [Phlebopus sp. FC_14]
MLSTPPAPSEATTDIEWRQDRPCNADKFELFIFYTLFFAIILAVALGTFSGFLSMIIGQSVLRAANYSGYDVPLSSSMKIGAAGGAVVPGISILIIALASNVCGLWHYWEVDGLRHVTKIGGVVVGVALNAAAGAAGAGLMNTYQPGLDCLDSVHAARAGALGATIVSSPAVLLTLLRLAWVCLTLPC